MRFPFCQVQIPSLLKDGAAPPLLQFQFNNVCRASHPPPSSRYFLRSLGLAPPPDPPFFQALSFFLFGHPQIFSWAPPLFQFLESIPNPVNPLFFPSPPIRPSPPFPWKNVSPSNFSCRLVSDLKNPRVPHCALARKRSLPLLEPSLYSRPVIAPPFPYPCWC